DHGKFRRMVFTRRIVAEYGGNFVDAVSVGIRLKFRGEYLLEREFGGRAKTEFLLPVPGVKIRRVDIGFECGRAHGLGRQSFENPARGEEAARTAHGRVAKVYGRHRSGGSRYRVSSAPATLS